MLTRIAALLWLSSSAYADDAKPATPAREPYEARSMRAHFLGLRGNIGQSYEVGLGYIHAHEDWSRSGYFWFGYGPDVRLTLDSDGVAGATVLALGRTAIVTHGIPTGFELGIGAARGNDKTHFVTTFGMFVTGYYGDIGYEYQLALDRPGWLGAHFFAMRAHIPVFRYAKRSRIEN